MLPTRTAFRSASAVRATRINGLRVRRNVRFASDSSNAPPPSASGAITGGLVGGGAALVVTYAWYHFSGAKTTLQTAKQAKSYIDSATESLKVKFDEKTPDDTSEAIKTLHNAANKYASFIPGGKEYVDSAFNDLEAIRKHHGNEADKIVREAYDELRDVSKKGMSLDAANQAYNVLSKHLQRLLELGKDAAKEILENHPQLKEKLGGSAEQLKQYANRIGPEAKQELDDAWNQVNDIVQAGLSGEAIFKARQLLQDKSQKLKQLGDQSFNSGLEQLKPLLNNSPQIKQFVEQNMETLKQGNISQTLEKVSQAVSSGSTNDLEQYMNQIKQKAQQFSGGQLTQWLSMVPGGSQILPQLEKLQQIAQKEGPEAEQLARDTVNELKQVLDKKSSKVEELYQKGKQEVKS